ncbi:transposase [Rhodococcus wratislaviensis IFP 2016]|nr:transposase [Rhodococcus wratislaviensis IFP 2016]
MVRAASSSARRELERFFHLDDEDRRLIADRRRNYNRLGFAVQLVTVRHRSQMR